MSHPELLLAVGLFSAFIFALSQQRQPRPLPPGPSPWPIIGNMLDMPKEKAWLKYTEWKSTYGDLLSLSAFGRTMVILNTAQAAFDLLHKRSSFYSDRPYLPMGGELVGWDHGLALTPYGDYFRKRRRLMAQVLAPRPVQAFWPLLELQATRLVNRLLMTPEKFVDQIRRTSAAISLKISHGYLVSETQTDPLVALAETALEQFSQSTVPGAFLVDFLPWLKYVPSWFPGANFKRIAAEWRKDLFRTADTAHNFTKNQMANGTATLSFTSELLGDSYTPEKEFLVKWTAFSIYGAGSDTTVAAIETFFLAMCTHPQVQALAQAELDSVVGKNRLPTIADRSALPYVEAVMREVFRWGPAVPGGIPHRLTQEDVYQGYRIPAGSIVVPNIWAMTHDPELFPYPGEFRPERFMELDKMENAALDPLQLAFGFGRRICPGQHLAEPTVFIAIAMTLATLTISKAHDNQTGEILEPSIEWSSGVISHPQPFRCAITPRSATAIGLVQRVVEDNHEVP